MTQEQQRIERIRMLAEEMADQPPMSARERTDRGLVSSYCHYSGSCKDVLPKKVQRALDQAIWRLQDGYGSEGYTPVQGWDWSGIRDSSTEAFRRMAAVVEVIVAVWG